MCIWKLHKSFCICSYALWNFAVSQIRKLILYHDAWRRRSGFTFHRRGANENCRFRALLAARLTIGKLTRRKDLFNACNSGTMLLKSLFHSLLQHFIILCTSRLAITLWERAAVFWLWLSLCIVAYFSRQWCAFDVSRCARDILEVLSLMQSQWQKAAILALERISLCLVDAKPGPHVADMHIMSPSP